jgi:hypothetical protein
MSPLSARVFLAGQPKAGKTTLAASWAPTQTLIIDTQRGTHLLDGEHYVQHVSDWEGFRGTVDLLVAGDHKFRCVVIDLIDDIWVFCDQAHAGRGALLATATDDYGRSGKNAEGAFRQTIGRLLTTDLGVWFISHTREVEEGGVTKHVPKLDPKVLTYIHGATQFVFLAEAGPKRVLHTQPSARFGAGSRVPLPEPMPMDARALYQAMQQGLREKQQPKDGKEQKKEEK